MLLFLNKSSIFCFKFLLLIYSFHLQVYFLKKTRQNTLLGQWLVLDAKFSLAQSCEPALCNADIIFSCLCALYSQFRAMGEYNINITEKYQIIFNDLVIKHPTI